MPAYQVTSPDGKTFEITAPDGASQEQVLAYAQAQWASVPAEKPAAVKAGASLNEIPRQLGLTARYGLEGVPQALELFTEPLRKYVTDPLAQAVTGTKQHGRSLSGMGVDMADRLGLPKPQGANERVIGDASRLVAGAGGIGALGKVAAASPGMLGQAGKMFSQNMGQQAISAGAAGGAAGASREAGGTPGQQAIAGLAAGVLAPTAIGAIKSGSMKAASAIRNEFAPRAMDAVDNQINLTLRRSGVDWAGIDERTRQAVRNDVRQATAVGGDLDAAALQRLIDFRRVGATPTRGTLTLDPVQITREKNLSKTAANSVDVGLQTLPRIEHQNNRMLIDRVNEMGAARALPQADAADRVIGAQRATIDHAQNNINSLYQGARDTSGRSAQLDGAAFAQRANALLQENLAGKLPTQVETAMNNIAMGKAQLTVEHAEQLKTMIGRIQRNSSDGNERYALGLIRQALDEAPLRGAPQVNPGNLPAVPGTVPVSPSVLGQESIEAFNAARSANRQFMQRLEQSPSLQAVMDGAQPDNFMQQHVMRSGATAQDLRSLREAIAHDAASVETVKNYIAGELKRKALSGAADEVGNFSQSAYNKALHDFGRRRLEVFFSPAEIDQLEAVGRVASYTQFQPRGSAVNNSNSGALVLGKGLDFLSRIAPKVPVVNDTITGTLAGIQQRQAQNISQGLLSRQAGPSFMDQLAPAMVYGGLLAPSQVVNNR